MLFINRENKKSISKDKEEQEQEQKQINTDNRKINDN